MYDIFHQDQYHIFDMLSVWKMNWIHVVDKESFQLLRIHIYDQLKIFFNNHSNNTSYNNEFKTHVDNRDIHMFSSMWTLCLQT